MIRVLILVLICLPFLSFADTGIMVKLHQRVVSQGSLQEASLLLDTETLSKLDTKNLAGTTINETLYLAGVSPFLKSNGSSYSATATVIFLKKPNKESGELETAKGKVLVTWGAIDVTPTEAPQEFLFGSFEIPRPRNILLWVIIILCLLLSFIPARRFYEKRKKHQAHKLNLKLLKKELMDANNYDGIVNIWKKKHLLLTTFPQINDSFLKFEEVLFKVQFKPTQNEIERESVIRAYNIFLEDIKGVMSGV